MNLAVLLNTHENSPVFRDTLDSIRHYWTNNVLVVVDGKNWDQFKDQDLPALKLEGFNHGKASAPYRNMCLGLMKAWECWGESVDWYVYLEYDCLVGSGGAREHLRVAGDDDVWLLGNDHRVEDKKFPFINSLEKDVRQIHYFLGCCLFFNKKFMSTLAKNDFFLRFLNFTNFNDRIFLLDSSGKRHMVYDLSEFLYPTLAVHYGGKIRELACWTNPGWRGNYKHYPMRFRPDLMEDPFHQACVLHPLKDYDNPVRAYNRHRRLNSL